MRSLGVRDGIQYGAPEALAPARAESTSRRV